MVKILAAADLHGDIDIAKKLSQKAKESKVDLIILAGDLHGAIKGNGEILKPFIEKNQKVLFIPGNWDSIEEMYGLKKGGKNIHDYYVTFEDVGIAGIGSPDWRLSLNKKDTAKTYENLSRMKSKKKILVSHLHAKGTMAEWEGIEGEKVLRDLIEHWQPDLFIASHIHSAEGIEEKIGKTKVIQVGRKGKIIEL